MNPYPVVLGLDCILYTLSIIKSTAVAIVPTIFISNHMGRQKCNVVADLSQEQTAVHRPGQGTVEKTS